LEVKIVTEEKSCGLFGHKKKEGIRERKKGKEPHPQILD